MLLEHHRGEQSRFEAVGRTVLDHPAKTSLRFANGLELFVVRELVEPRLDSRRSIQLLYKPLFGRLKGLNCWGLARTHELTRKHVLFKMPKRRESRFSSRLVAEFAALATQRFYLPPSLLALLSNQIPAANPNAPIPMRTAQAGSISPQLKLRQTEPSIARIAQRTGLMTLAC